MEETMSDHKMLDFLSAIVGGESTLLPPTVSSVRFQVRTGITVPPKVQMRKTGYENHAWRYRVKDLKTFSSFLANWETAFSDAFNTRSRNAGLLNDSDPADLVIQQSYLGTFPARGPAGSAINRFVTSWGGRNERLGAIDRCRVDVAGLVDAEDRWLAAEIAKLLEHADGDVDVEILDPSIGF
jgi:hypothetical protein